MAFYRKAFCLFFKIVAFHFVCSILFNDEFNYSGCVPELGVWGLADLADHLSEALKLTMLW